MSEEWKEQLEKVVINELYLKMQGIGWVVSDDVKPPAYFALEKLINDIFTTYRHQLANELEEMKLLEDGDPDAPLDQDFIVGKQIGFNDAISAVQEKLRGDE